MKFLKNKKVVLASGIILGIAAITSSALAAYIVTGGKKDGNTDVEPTEITIDNKVTDLTVDAPSNELLFQPETQVTKGRITTDKAGNLTVTIPLTITAQAQSNIPEMTVEVTVKQGTAVEEQYVALPTDIPNITSENFSLSGTEFKHNLKIPFKWGTKFGGDPATYFNTGAGKDTPISDVITEMNDFAESINGTVFTVTIDEAPAAAA